jgi:hypothetical protein
MYDASVLTKLSSAPQWLSTPFAYKLFTQGKPNQPLEGAGYTVDLKVPKSFMYASTSSDSMKKCITFFYTLKLCNLWYVPKGRAAKACL